MQYKGLGISPTDIAVVGGIAALLYFLWTKFPPGESTPDPNVQTAPNPFPGAGDVPVIPSDYSYVNPWICALTGKFCPPSSTTSTTGCYAPNQWGTGPVWEAPSGNYVEQPDGTWCVV